jgi:hypothetical protein
MGLITDDLVVRCRFNKVSNAMQFEHPFRDIAAEEAAAAENEPFEDHFAFLDEWKYYPAPSVVAGKGRRNNESSG